MLDKLKQLAVQVWNNDTVRRVFHTFWQAFLATVLAGFFTVNDTHTAWALVVAAVAAGLSAVKGYLAARWS